MRRPAIDSCRGPARRPQADRVDGVLLLDKARGQSSNAALQTARRLLNARKAGHTGTLDPLADGLLPLTFGEATKFAGELLDADKEYEAVLALGATTSTGDAEGEVIETLPVAVTRSQFETVLSRFTGTIEQVPPMHSALKREGRPLYELARSGVTVERRPRRVTVSRLRLIEWDGRTPRIGVACSKGTYVRVLAEDIGRALSCGAHLAALRRTRVGRLQLEDGVSLAQLEGEPLAARRARLLPLDALLQDWPGVELQADAAARYRHGQAVACAAADAPRVRVYGDGRRLLGVGVVRDGRVAAIRTVDTGADGAATDGKLANLPER